MLAGRAGDVELRRMIPPLGVPVGGALQWGHHGAWREPDTGELDLRPDIPIDELGDGLPAMHLFDGRQNQ